jgi:DNA alkylation damage repair protein AlkB
MSYPKHPGASPLSKNPGLQPPGPNISQETRVSFFQDDPARVLRPKDSTVHQPLTIKTFLDRKLRWITLGGQYNWTDKRYPAGLPPTFPEDIMNLLAGIFPETKAQAGIVNFYSPGDTLSVHRDVSEECDMGLISISLGCDGLFIVGHTTGSGCEVIRLRSGDAIYMTGESRFSWHGVPKIIPSTCPIWLRDWPGGLVADASEDSQPFEQWHGWMNRKRVNLNVRQMTEAPRER